MLQSKLKAVYNTLTTSEKLVADYIMENLDGIKTITSYQLAKTLGVGQSTVIRFSQKLGYKSFRELLSEIAKEFNEKLSRDDIDIKESTQATNEKIVAQYIDIANLTIQHNKPETIDEVVAYMRSAEEIVSFGIGNSNLFAEYFANQLITMGIDVFSSNNAHVVLSKLNRMKKGSLIFLFSESGESKDIIRAAKIARKQGIITISLTKNKKNSLHSYSDILLKTVNYENDTRMNATTIRCSQLCLIDMLTLNLLKKDFKRYKNNIDESRKQLESALIVKR